MNFLITFPFRIRSGTDFSIPFPFPNRAKIDKNTRGGTISGVRRVPDDPTTLRGGGTFGVLKLPDGMASPGGGPLLVFVGCRIGETARDDGKLGGWGFPPHFWVGRGGYRR